MLALLAAHQCTVLERMDSPIVHYFETNAFLLWQCSIDMIFCVDNLCVLYKIDIRIVAPHDPHVYGVVYRLNAEKLKFML